jgi:hypothetical protein
VFGVKVNVIPSENPINELAVGVVPVVMMVNACA